MINIKLIGSMPSKKNQWKRGKYGNVYLESSVQKKLDDFIWQIKEQKIPKISGKVRLWVMFHIKRDIDLDNLLGGLCDILQKAGTIENDSQIMEIEAFKKKSATPKVEINLELIK